jgi:hypothetical protein
MEAAVAKSYNKSVTTKLAALRQYARTGVKEATFGGKGDDTPFEQAFSNLAHAYLQDKAPGLLDHEIGFQLLDRNSENTKAVGVFAFKVGSMWLYAPMFFLNGDLKGHELLYLKNQDMFVPLKENWINYLINRKPNVLGQGVDRNMSALGQRQPDFTQLSRSPSKFGSAKPTLKEMINDALPGLAKAATTNTQQAFAEIGAALDLRTFLKESRLTAIDMLVKTCQHAPELAAALEEFHGLDIVKEAIEHAKQREYRPKIASVLESAPEEPESVKGLKVINFDTTMQTKLPKGYTAEEQEKLTQDGVLILDSREQDNVSVPYHIQVARQLFNPTSSGLYDILVKPGAVERCYVAVYPMGAGKRADFVTVVRTEGRPDWINIRADHVFALTRIEGEEFDKWFDGLKAATSLPTGRSRSILISKRGDSTCPIRVLRELGKTTYGTTAYEVHLEDHTKHPPRGHISDCCYNDPLRHDKWRDGVRVHLNANRGTSLRNSMGDIFIPEDFKLLKCSPGEDDAESTDSLLGGICGCGESDTPPLMPGNLVDAQLSLIQKTAALTVCHNGSEITVNDSAFDSRNAALVHLVKDHGLREKAAREIMQNAEKTRKTTIRIKYANPYGPPMMVNDAPTAPTIPGPVMGGESVLGTSQPTQLGIDLGIPVSGMSAMRTDRSVYNPNPMYDKNVLGKMPERDIQQILDAANSGQKEVFDTAMIGGMLRAVRDDSLVDRYMGELTKGLDKLGRILFMFYWHGDRFSERYGKSDMPELEDSLRNAFEMLGDVILFLKQKTIDPYPDTNSQNVDLGDVASS